MDSGVLKEIEENNKRIEEGSDMWKTDPTDVPVVPFGAPFVGDRPTREDLERQRIENDEVYRS